MSSICAPMQSMNVMVVATACDRDAAVLYNCSMVWLILRRRLRADGLLKQCSCCAAERTSSIILRSDAACQQTCTNHKQCVFFDPSMKSILSPSACALRSDTTCQTRSRCFSLQSQPSRCSCPANVLEPVRVRKHRFRRSYCSEPSLLSNSSTSHVNGSVPTPALAKCVSCLGLRLGTRFADGSGSGPSAVASFQQHVLSNIFFLCRSGVLLWDM